MSTYRAAQIIASIHAVRITGHRVHPVLGRNNMGPAQVCDGTMKKKLDAKRCEAMRSAPSDPITLVIGSSALADWYHYLWNCGI